MSDAAAQRRARQTVINLLLSIAATVGVVILMVLVVPRDDSNQIPPVDYKSVAADATEATGRPLIVPEIEADWWSNSARLSTKPKDGTDASWYAGFVGPKNQYIGFTQTFNTNPTWLALQLTELTQTGEVQLNGLTWQIWQSVERHDPPKTKDFMMVGQMYQDTFLIYGTAPEPEMTSFAGEVSELIAKVYP
jgi:hypothetical protein